MNDARHKKLKRLLRQAEGYLELQMSHQALEVLQAIDDPGPFEFPLHLLRGQVHRDLQDYHRALVYLEAAAQIKSDSVSLQMALAWCYKRTDRLPLAVQATEYAHRLDPQEPILMYNLACYLSLAGEKDQALNWLGRALRAAPAILKMIPEESDFDPLRRDPDFVRMLELADSPKT